MNISSFQSPCVDFFFFFFNSSAQHSVSDQDVGHLPVPLLLHRRQQDQLRAGAHLDGGIAASFFSVSIRESLRGRDPIYPFQYFMHAFNMQVKPHPLKQSACRLSADGQDSALKK